MSQQPLDAYVPPYKLCEVTGDNLTPKQIAILEDELDRHIRLNPEEQAAIQRLRENLHYRMIAGIQDPK